jgi:hypothetical protein
MRGNVESLDFTPLDSLVELDLSQQALFGSWPSWTREIKLEKLFVTHILQGED